MDFFLNLLWLSVHDCVIVSTKNQFVPQCWPYSKTGTIITFASWMMNLNKHTRMSTFRNSSGLIVSIMVMLLMIGGGCKSKKKAMEAEAAAERARLEQETALKHEREEAARKRQEEERARLEAEAVAREPYKRLDLYFNAISNSGNTAAANSNINEALTLFASPETPVLIVISEEGGRKDYDRPTTIRNYLNYLKDQRTNPNKIGNLQFDSSGKITEVELIKQ
jgi:hypothetical protein